jgi:hypothetical protein
MMINLTLGPDKKLVSEGPIYIAGRTMRELTYQQGRSLAKRLSKDTTIFEFGRGSLRAPASCALIESASQKHHAF